MGFILPLPLGEGSRERVGGEGLLPDALQHRFGLPQYFVVPETQDGKSLLPEPSIPAGIVGSLLGMLATVELDNQMGAEANEIDDIGPIGICRLNFSPRKRWARR